MTSAKIVLPTVEKSLLLEVLLVVSNNFLSCMKASTVSSLLLELLCVRFLHGGRSVFPARIAFLFPFPFTLTLRGVIVKHCTP